MRENEGHLFADVAGQPFQSCCVKCGMVVDWMKVRNEDTTVPKCIYATQKSVPNLIDGYDFDDLTKLGNNLTPHSGYTIDRWVRQGAQERGFYGSHLRKRTGKKGGRIV